MGNLPFSPTSFLAKWSGKGFITGETLTLILSLKKGEEKAMEAGFLLGRRDYI